MPTPRIDRITQEEKDSDTAADFPYRTDICDMYRFPRATYPWHWHNEVELFFMQRGSLAYHIPGQVIDFFEGDAGFVNANVMHLTAARDGSPCLQQEHIFLPSFIAGESGSRIEAKYVLPLLKAADARIVRFERGTEACAAAVSCMERAFALYGGRSFAYETEIRSCMTRLWLLVLSQCSGGGTVRATRQTVDEQRLRAMMLYISGHYGSGLRVADIAAAAAVGERECCRCFARQIGTSPMDYVTDFRLEKACSLLRGSDLPVEGIAERCGFGSSSYFCKLFRDKMGMSPRQYRLGREREEP